MKKLLILLQTLSLLHANSTVPGEFVKHSGTPDNGFVDSYHKLNSDWDVSYGLYDDKVLKAFYLLRKLKTLDLIRSRKALIQMLPENKRNSEYFELPEEVSDIFLRYKKIKQVQLLNNQLRIFNAADSDTIIQKKKNNYLFELVQVAISLNYFDRLIKHYHQDIWLGNSSFDIHAAHENAILQRDAILNYRGSGNHSFGPIITATDPKGIKIAKDKLLEKLGIADFIQTLASQKAYVLNRYNLLGAQIKYKNNELELYRVIYLVLKDSFNLPDLTIPIEMSKFDFSKEEVHDFSVDDIKQDRLATFLANMTQKEIIGRIQPVIWQAVEKALEGNTEFLKDLNQNINVWENPAPFFLMSLNEKNWRMLRENAALYGISDADIDHAQTKAIELVNDDHHRRKHMQKLLKYTSYGIAAGSVILWATGVGGIISIGLARTVAHSGMVVSGSFYGAKVITSYLDDSKYAKLSRNLFIATKGSGDYQTQFDSRVMADSSYSDVVLLTVMSIIFARTPVWYVASKTAQSVSALGSGLVRIGQNQMQAIRTLFAKIPLNMHGSRFASGSIELVSSSHHQLNLIRNRINQGFAKKGFTRADVMSFLGSKSEAISNLIKFPHIRNTVKREMFVETLAVITGEVMARKDRFFEEWDEALMNSLFALTVTFNIASKVSSSNHIIWEKLVAEKYVRHIPMEQRVTLNFGGVLKNGYDLVKPVVATGAFFNAAFLLKNYIENPDDFSSDDVLNALETVFWMTVIVPSISPIKGEVVYKRFNYNIENAFKKRFGNIAGLKAAEDVLVPISVANNSIGIFTLATVLRATGAQGHGADLGLIYEDIEIYQYETNKDHIDYFID